jgi:polyisoprenoid-binding protein YceI
MKIHNPARAPGSIRPIFPSYPAFSRKIYLLKQVHAAMHLLDMSFLAGRSGFAGGAVFLLARPLFRRRNRKDLESMKRLAFALGILGLTAPLALAQASTWAVDPAHSEVDFSIRHMGLSNVRGHFGSVKGAIAYDSADVAKSSVNVTIDVTSVDTGNSPRDNDLKTDAFFDVAKFPTATFASTSVAKNGSHLTVAGNLTLHGVTKPVTLDVSVPVTAVSPMDHKLHSGYEATTTINRFDFNIGSKFPSAILGEDVPLTIDIEAVKQ